MRWTFQLLNTPYGGVTEGPVWDGEAPYFTHIPASRIMRYDPCTGAIATWRTGTNRTNGLAYDLEGRLFGCCSGGRGIVRFDPDGTTATIADRLDGKRLNTPNDLTIDGMYFDADGNIVATAGWELGGPGPLLSIFSPTGRVLETHPMPALRPTNCCFGGPDMTTLFVTTTQGHFCRVETDRVGWAVSVGRSLLEPSPQGHRRQVMAPSLREREPHASPSRG
jgi:sugar lactone lactonase YvrE